MATLIKWGYCMAEGDIWKIMYNCSYGTVIYAVEFTFHFIFISSHFKEKRLVYLFENKNAFKFSCLVDKNALSFLIVPKDREPALPHTGWKWASCPQPALVVHSPVDRGEVLEAGN